MEASSLRNQLLFLIFVLQLCSSTGEEQRPELSEDRKLILKASKDVRTDLGDMYRPGDTLFFRQSEMVFKSQGAPKVILSTWNAAVDISDDDIIVFDHSHLQNFIPPDAFLVLLRRNPREYSAHWAYLRNTKSVEWGPFRLPGKYNNFYTALTPTEYLWTSYKDDTSNMESALHSRMTESFISSMEDSKLICQMQVIKSPRCSRKSMPLEVPRKRHEGHPHSSNSERNIRRRKSVDLDIPVTIPPTVRTTLAKSEAEAQSRETEDGEDKGGKVVNNKRTPPTTPTPPLPQTQGLANEVPFANGEDDILPPVNNAKKTTVGSSSSSSSESTESSSGEKEKHKQGKDETHHRSKNDKIKASRKTYGYQLSEGSRSINLPQAALGAFYVTSDKHSFNKSDIIEHLEKIPDDIMTNFINYYVDHRNGHPQFEASRLPFTGFMDCRTGDTVLQEEGRNPPRYVSVVDKLLKMLKADCHKKLRSATFKLFQNKFVAFEGPKSSVICLHKESFQLLSKPLLSGSEWEALLSSTYLSKFSEAVVQRVKDLKRNPHLNTSPAGRPISHTLRTLSLFVEKTLGVLIQNSSTDHAAKLTLSLYQTVSAFRDRNDKESLILDLLCKSPSTSSCAREKDKNMENGKQLDVLSDYVIHVTPLILTSSHDETLTFFDYWKLYNKKA